MPGGEVQATDTQAVMSGSRHSYPRQPFDLTLSAILVIAGALRLGVLLIRSSDTSRFLNPDSAGYLTLSRDLSAFVRQHRRLAEAAAHRSQLRDHPTFFSRLIRCGREATRETPTAA